MGNETQKVDVLLAFDNAATHFHRQRMPSSSEEMRLARDAVADLIDAARIALNYLPESGLSRERLIGVLVRIGGAA